MEIQSIDTSELTRGTLEVKIIHIESPLLFWVQLKNGEGALTDLLEELNFRMNRKSNSLFYWPHKLRENEAVAVKVKNIWQRGLVVKINRDIHMVKIALRDWGIIVWKPMGHIYILEEQFRKLRWQSIKCGLAHTEPPTEVTEWPTPTKQLCKILAENKEGWLKIIQPYERRTAAVKLIIYNEHDNGTNNLRDILVQLGHAKLTDKVKVNVFPSI